MHHVFGLEQAKHKVLVLLLGKLQPKMHHVFGLEQAKMHHVFGQPQMKSRHVLLAKMLAKHLGKLQLQLAKHLAKQLCDILTPMTRLNLNLLCICHLPLCAGFRSLQVSVPTCNMISPEIL